MTETKLAHVKKISYVSVIVFVFSVSFMSLFLTLDDYGLTWDEPEYIRHALMVEEWFGALIHFDDPFSPEVFDTNLKYNRYHNSHPLFQKVSGVFFANISDFVFSMNSLYGFRMSTIFWSSIFLAVFAIYFTKIFHSPLIGVLGAMAFLTVPRFFAHMHFFVTDMMVAAFGFIATYCFVFIENRRKKIFFSGLVFGILLATKFTGVLLFPVLFSFVIFERFQKKALIDFVLTSCLGIVFFVVFNPIAWRDPLQEMLFYFVSTSQRGNVIPISVLYFGRSFSFLLPWHQPVVTTAMTLPAVITAFGVVGLMKGLFNLRDRAHFFEVIPTLILFSFFVLPQTPKHDGIRLFSSSWPFIVALAIRGMFVVSSAAVEIVEKSQLKLSLQHRSNAVFAVLISLSIVVSLHGTLKYHPFQLSFYNAFVGGADGAQQKGFSISYWYEALNHNELQKMADAFGDRPVKVFSYPNSQIIDANNWMGLSNFNFVSCNNVAEAEYILYLNRFANKDIEKYFDERSEPVIFRAVDNTLVLGMFKTIQE